MIYKEPKNIILIGKAILSNDDQCPKTYIGITQQFNTLHDVLKGTITRTSDSLGIVKLFGTVYANTHMKFLLTKKLHPSSVQ